MAQIDYAQLEIDLVAARDAAIDAATRVADGGSSNFDSLELHLPRARTRRVEGVAAKAGLQGYKWRNSRFHFSNPIYAQGFRRTIQVETMARVMRERAWDARVYSKLD